MRPLYRTLTCAALLLAGPQMASAEPNGVTAQSSSIYDFLVMNVCTDSTGAVTNESPLECTRQRNLRPREALPYTHSNYQGEGKPGCRLEQRRFSFPLSEAATDQTGARFPLIVGWLDASAEGCTWSSFDDRDTASLISIYDGYASIVGATHHGRWHVAIGTGYGDSKKTGLARFSRTWSFPADVPAMGAIGYQVFRRRTQALNSIEEVERLPTHGRVDNLRPTFTVWRRDLFQYGTPSQKTRALDTLMTMNFSSSNASGDAPGEISAGSERLYLTKELGYVTRWEVWTRADNHRKDVLAEAQKAYALKACTKPIAPEGRISPNFEAQPLVEDAQEGTYKQTFSITDSQTHTSKSYTWYMTGCHDFTNVKEVPPFIPEERLGEANFGASFMRLFRRTTSIP